MLRRRIAASWTAVAGATVAGRRAFFQPTAPCSLVYTPPGSRREGSVLPWHSQSFSQQAAPAAAALPHSAPATQRLDSAASPEVRAGHSAVPPPASPQPPQQRQPQRAPPASSPSPSVGGSSNHHHDGVLRATPPRRMSALSGPSLDVRIDEIIKVEETVSSQLLPEVVQLLIDPQAEGVERIALSDFAAMQPRRQLMAVGGNKQWLEFLLNSPYYQQVASLASESPAHDLRALQQAGITTLYQWADNPNVVKVSARSKSALDGAVEQSIRTYMNEVAQVVNTSNQLEPLLNSWMSDVVGKFVLDSLKVSVESASAALWARNGGYEGSKSDRSRHGKARHDTVSALGAMLDNEAASRSGGGGAATTEAVGGGGGQGPVLRPGEACTLEHYYLFLQKVLYSVREDFQSSYGGPTHKTGAIGIGDAQTEAEVLARTHTVVATALTQLLEQAVAQHLPNELRPLYNNGYIAVDRMPALLRRAVSFLQLRAIPVRYFVFHSTADASPAAGTTASTATATAGGSSSSLSRTEAAAAVASAGPMSGAFHLSTPVFGAGTFLTGSTKMDVTLGAWSGQPEPASSTDTRDPAQLEYFSVLHRIRTHLDKLSMTSLHEVLSHAAVYGADGFEAFEAIGLDQLFGHAKLVEDRLVSLLNYPPATSEKPMHFIEAGHTTGKTAILERLAQRTRTGERAVIVRYSGTSTPFVPDLDDHPVAFASRFWFRVALSSCPFLIRTEELFSRAPRSVWWWGNAKNWSWESFQTLIASANHVGWSRGAREATSATAGGVLATQAQLTTILVDDFDRPLDSMEAKWSFSGRHQLPGGAGGGGGGAVGAGGASAAAAAFAAGTTPISLYSDNGRDSGAVNRVEEELEEDEAAAEEEEKQEGGGGGEDNTQKTRASAEAKARQREERRMLAAMKEAEERRVGVALWMSTGKDVPDLVSNAFAKLTVALGQVDFVFTGQRVSPMLLQHVHVPVRRCFIPVSNGVGLQQRLRVLPLLAVLHALHLRSHLEMPGLLYEVLKNCPALTGKTIELFWSGRIAQLDLRASTATSTAGGSGGGGGGGGGVAGGGLSSTPRLLFGDSGPLVHSYEPRELYAEMPLSHHLLRYPRRTRLHLVELLQRQLSSPSGYLNSGIDTDARDVSSGLVTPHSHTTCQVHPFALFTIFSHQDALELSASSSSSAASSSPSSAGSASSAASSGGGASALVPQGKEKKVVRAWAEVWAEYRSVVNELASTPSRKRDAMRVLLHGALLLRSAAVAGANLELNLKVPSYGFPLLSTEVRMKGKHVVQPIVDGAEVRPATADTVRKAAASYKSFFSNASQSHFPFRPMVGLNGGCDVVCVSGTTLGLYDIVTTMQELRDVPFRFAEALVGVLHVLERQVMPVDKVKHVQYVSVVSIDQAAHATALNPGKLPSSSSASRSTRTEMIDVLAACGGGVGAGAGGLSPAMIPYLLDLSALFEDSVLDRLKAIQEPLGITKEFRTLSDILDELERRFNVRVRQEIVASHEELEALLSPTLLQLVPDATVLPRYTQAVVSAEDLMMEAMLGGSASGSNSGNKKVSANALPGMDLTRALDDDDDDADDEFPPGAEVDDATIERALSSDESAAQRVKHDVLLADGEALHESAELLEAMLNDRLDDITDNTSTRVAMARTAQELRNDLMTENSINYYGSSAVERGGVPSASSLAPTGPGTTTAAPQRKQSSNELDSLAWLHDIITPDSVLAGVQGTPRPGTAAATAPESGVGATSPSSSPLAAAALGGNVAGRASGQQTLTSGLQEDDNEDDVEGLDAVGLLGGKKGGGANADANANVDAEEEEESAQWREALARGGVEATASVFPKTAAKRKTHRGAAPASGAARAGSEGDDESDLVKLLDLVGSRNSKARRAASAGNKKRKTAPARGGGKRKPGAGGRSAGRGSGGPSVAAKRKKAAASPSSKAAKSKKKPAPKKGKK